MTATTEDMEAQRKAMIHQTFETVANGYGVGGARFFHLSGKEMAELHSLNGSEEILDVASGTGAAAIPLAKLVPNGQVTAVDFSPAMLKKANDYANAEQLNNIQFEIHDMTNLPFDEGRFAHANCAFGLFFVEDMVSLLTHISSKVRSGGNVIISGFCGDSFMPYANMAFDRMKRYGLEIPEQRFGWKRMSEPEQLHALFSDAGLKDVTITRKSLGYYTDENGWWDVMWYAGFRGLIEQLGDKLEEFKREHLAEVKDLMNENGLWLEIDVNYTRGTVV